MKYMKQFITAAALTMSLNMTVALASDELPGKGISVQPARATWNTGYFNEALARKGLEELGYKVKKVKELQNPIFYQSVAMGDVDYWMNGWFPTHDAQMPKNFDEKAQIDGYIIKSGGLQGYLVSKKQAEELNIKSLDDFKRDDVKKAFDANGDGKADLVGCPAGWGCEKVIEHHMKSYDLDKHINVIKASYNASVADAITRYKMGEPVLIYTWAPSWMVFKLKPGVDALWLNVPSIMPSEAQIGSEEMMTAVNIDGGVTKDVDLGFVVSDIRAVMNNKFSEKNPAAHKFLSLIELSLGDMNEQNTLMQDGEDKQKDIEHHVDMWIEKNQEVWNGWLDEARASAK